MRRCTSVFLAALASATGCGSETLLDWQLDASGLPAAPDTVRICFADGCDGSGRSCALFPFDAVPSLNVPGDADAVLVTALGDCALLGGGCAPLDAEPLVVTLEPDRDPADCGQSACRPECDADMGIPSDGGPDGGALRDSAPPDMPEGEPDGGLLDGGAEDGGIDAGPPTPFCESLPDVLACEDFEGGSVPDYVLDPGTSRTAVTGLDGNETTAMRFEASAGQNAGLDLRFAARSSGDLWIRWRLRIDDKPSTAPILLAFEEAAFGNPVILGFDTLARTYIDLPGGVEANGGRMIPDDQWLCMEALLDLDLSASSDSFFFFVDGATDEVARPDLSAAVYDKVFLGISGDATTGGWTGNVVLDDIVIDDERVPCP